MNIAFINCLKCWGGGEKWHLEHALYMHKCGHRVTLVTLKGSPLEERATKQGLKCKTFDSVFFLNPFNRMRVKAFLKAEQFDCIVMNSANDLKIFAPLAKKVGVKKVVFRRGSDIPIKDTFFNRRLYKNYITDILANSESTKGNVLSRNPNLFPKDKITVIYNGIDVNQTFETSTTGNDVPVVATLGRIAPQKRHDVFIKIAKVLKDRGVRCRFVIGGDGELKAQMESLVKELQVEDYVSFAGFISKPLDFIAKCDVFALTSEWEGFGYVLAEAMLVKKPIVAFSTSSNVELVNDGVNGKLVDWCDIEGFATAIQYMLENRESALAMAVKGNEIVKAKFDFNKNIKQVEAFLTDF